MSKGSILFAIVLLIFSCKGEPYEQGRLIYEVNCGNCHMENGQGLGEMYPDITKSDYVSDLRSQLPCIVRYGKAGGVLSTVAMPANEKLTPVAMTNLVNYISYKWGDGKVTNLQEIKDQLADCDQE